MYWATIIFLNTVLERLGVTSSMLAKQSAEAAISTIPTLSVLVRIFASVLAACSLPFQVTQSPA
jgi:hypothetical protein